MKKLILTLAALAVFSQAQTFAVDFGTADEQFVYNADFPSCRQSLEALLPAAVTATDKAEVYWRLARVCHATGKFTEGKEFAEKAIAANPNSPDAYMWHCVCAGWESKSSGSVVKMAGCVPVMLGDIDTILEKLGRKDYSHAWHAKGEIYFNHPFKSNDTAEEYVRTAIRTMPAEETGLATHILLYRIVSLKDKEEGRKILLNAKALYLSKQRHSAEDNKNYKELCELILSDRSSGR